MTPLHLQLFIDACTLACPFAEFPSNNKMPLHQEYMDQLEQLGLVETRGGPPEMRRYHPTEMGRAYLHFLCNLPMPVSKWAVTGMDGLTYSEA